jgi:hypothetical protein
MEKPKCQQCRHFFITWDQKTPNGCRRFGIQSRELPSIIVKASGMGDCQGFEAKAEKKPAAGLDLTRKDLW